MNKVLRENSDLCDSDREMLSKVLRKMCCKHRLLPSSYAITNELEQVEEFPSNVGGSADVFPGRYRGSKVAIKQIRHGPNRTSAEIVRLHHISECGCADEGETEILP